MLKIISKYAIGENDAHVTARINGRIVSTSISDLRNEAIKFKQAQAHIIARNILNLRNTC